MKKFFVIGMILVVLLLTGCNNKDTEAGKENKNDEKLSLVDAWIKEQIPTYTSTDITLPEVNNDYEALIEWESSDSQYLDDMGLVNVDKRAIHSVDLTYTIKIQDDVKEGKITVAVSAYNFDDISDLFIRQFHNIISRDYEVTTEYYDYFTVDWKSSNTDAFSNEGICNRSRSDVDIQIIYNINILGETSEEYTFNATVLAISDLQVFEEVSKWLQSEALVDLYLTEKVTLPTKYEKYDLPISWKSSNNDVISLDGKITHYVFERYITLSAIVEINDLSVSTNFECIVSPKDITKMNETEILEDFLKAIAVESYSGIKFNGNGAGCNQSFGALNFYVNENTNVIQNLIPIGLKNRTQILQEVKLIICHDTGNMNNGANAQANSNYVKSGYGGSSTGWHYTVGNDGVFQQVPDNEVAYNANGDSSTPTIFIKTDIKATAKKPNVTVNDDGYICFNNVASSVRVPNLSEGFASDGPLWEIGSDGYYYACKPWYCSSHGYNANQGGNANGIGIESAVNNGSDYLLTCRIFAKLVAELCIKHNLDLSRVVQHNTMSGKDCPNAMRSTDFWYTFKDMISLEKFAKENLKAYTFKWSGTGDIDNTGKILKDTKVNTVNYSVTVLKGIEEILTKSYITNLIK